MRTKMMVDGVEVKLNAFTQKFFAKILEGAVSALRDVDKGWEKLEISVDK